MRYNLGDFDQPLGAAHGTGNGANGVNDMNGANGVNGANWHHNTSGSFASLQDDSVDPSTELWYHKPARAFEEALPIGNGTMGAMVYGALQRERLALNEDTLWSGAPYTSAPEEAHRHLPLIRDLLFKSKYDEADALATESFMGVPPLQSTFLPFGDLTIETFDCHFLMQPTTEYKRSLDLTTSMATTRYRGHQGIVFTRRYIASADRRIIAVQYTADQPGKIFCRVMANCPHPHSSLSVEGGNEVVLRGRTGADLGARSCIEFVGRFKVEVKGGEIADMGDFISVSGATEMVVVFSLSTNFKRFDDVTGDPSAITRKSLDDVRDLSFTDLAAEAIKRHQRLFDRVKINLGDSRSLSTIPTHKRILNLQQGNADPALFALYFNFGRYLLISSSQPGSQPSTLQGIWNEDMQPNWQSKYTVNINIEMNYWPAESTNLPELLEPLVAMMKDLAVTGAVTAKRMYDARGWVCHHNTDLWRATAPIDAPKYGLWPMGGVWLSKHLWDHYDYGRDLTYLESIYDVLRGACLFFIDTAVEVNGQMITVPSMSPENPHGNGSTTLCAAPTLDCQLLRDLFNNFLEASRMLGKGDLRHECEEFVAKLRPTEIGKNGQVKEWADDWDHLPVDLEHRHVSHLYAIYPSEQIDPDVQTALAHAAAVTLNTRGDEGPGWSVAWKTCLWARLGNAERAHSVLSQLFGPQMIMPNMFDAHPPLDDDWLGCFQLDGNMGGTAGIAEMIVSCIGNAVRLLPALPKEWPTGHLTGIRLRGGWTLGIHWEDGKPSRVEVNAAIGGRKTIRYGGKSRDVELTAGQSLVWSGADFEKW